MEMQTEPVVLTQSRWFGVLGVALFGAAAALGWWALRSDDWRGWILLPFGAAVAVVFLVHMFRPHQLVITREGFGTRAPPLGGRSYWYDWDEVEPIKVAVGQRATSVMFAPVFAPVRPGSGSEPEYRGERVLDTYGMDPYACADLMNQWRNDALKAKRGGDS
jgi:hypothetical protein